MDLNTFEQQLRLPSPLTRIKDSVLDEFNIELWLKRDDLIHPIVSGNKWRKLKYSLNHALNIKSRRVISMGGAYSNHLHALAYVGKALGIGTAAFIRGERPKQLSPTLQDIEQWGMQLTFVSRSEYRKLRDYQGYDKLPGMQAGDYWLAEGGASELALRGVGDIAFELEQDYDVICVPCGTGTTLAGLINSVPNSTRLIGFAALKGADFLQEDIAQYLTEQNDGNWQLQLGYHAGGFAKLTNEVKQFILAFEQRHGVMLDPVYTGKMLFGIYDLIRCGGFSAGQRILAIHTGGLQGRRVSV